MIRLSEAMAKMACSDEVLPKHVQEAFRLLNKSIIRVETPDIDFENELVEQELEEGVINGETEESGSEGKPPTNGVGNEEEEKPTAGKVRVTYEEYKTVANLLILYLRQREDEDEEGDRELVSCGISMHACCQSREGRSSAESAGRLVSEGN